MKSRNGGKGMADEQVVAYETSSDMLCRFNKSLIVCDTVLWIAIFLDTYSLATE